MATVTLLLLFCIVVGAYSAPGDRRISVVNQCNHTVRVGVTGGQAKAPVNNSCPEGQILVALTTTMNACFWDAPPVENNKSRVLNSSQSLTFLITNPAQDEEKWSGNMWGATGCDESGFIACETGICFPDGQCPPYKGAIGPVTLAEFTLLENNVDTYDVSIINGVNLPVEMKADVTESTQDQPDGQLYWCGNAGGLKAANPMLSDCSWDFQFPVIDEESQAVPLTLVAKDTDNPECSSGMECDGDLVCGTLLGLTESGPTSEIFPGRCGRFIGLLNANEICAWAQSVDSPSTFPNSDPFQCKTSTGQFGGNGDTRGDLYGCSGAYRVSGYSVDSEKACGCPDWEKEGINAPATQRCMGNNTVWEKDALPWVQWLKKACPTSYVFQFDDESSTFQCRSQGEVNSQDYTITFCPGGKAVGTSGSKGVGHAMLTAMILALLITVMSLQY